MAPSFAVTAASLETGETNGNVKHLKNEAQRPVQSPDSPVPAVGDFDVHSYNSEEALLNDVTQSMSRSGGCIVRGLVDSKVLAELETEIRPHLDLAGPAPGDFWPPQTRKVMGLMGKSKSFALNVVGNPLWQKVGQHFLTSELENYWVGDHHEHSVSPPQLNNTVVFSINPGARAQALHRDDPVHHNWPAASALSSTYTLGRDTSIVIFLSGKRSTRQNGVTRFIPGSHLWDYSLPPSEELTFYPSLEPGDTFMMLSGCYHAGSANTTDDEERLLYSTGTTRGYLRQEENQYLAVDKEKLKEMGLPRLLLRFMGYDLSPPFCGWVEMDDPMKVLEPELESRGDLF